MCQWKKEKTIQLKIIHKFLDSCFENDCNICKCSKFNRHFHEIFDNTAFMKTVRKFTKFFLNQEQLHEAQGCKNYSCSWKNYW